jgi:hypothetical protein
MAFGGDHMRDTHTDCQHDGLRYFMGAKPGWGNRVKHGGMGTDGGGCQTMLLEHAFEVLRITVQAGSSCKTIIPTQGASRVTIGHIGILEAHASNPLQL